MFVYFLIPRLMIVVVSMAVLPIPSETTVMKTPSEMTAATMPSELAVTIMPSGITATTMPSGMAANATPSEMTATTMPSEMTAAAIPSGKAAAAMSSGIAAHVLSSHQIVLHQQNTITINSITLETDVSILFSKEQKQQVIRNKCRTITFLKDYKELHQHTSL